MAGMLDEQRKTEELIRAAGGLLVRRTSDGALEVAVVHRPERIDWSFPKGKIEPGETLEECAIREVFEETGLHCRLGPFIGHTGYRDRWDRPKVVAYWAMVVERGAFVAGREVDELRWTDLAEAARLLTYDRDRDLLMSLSAAARELFADEGGGA